MKERKYVSNDASGHDGSAIHGEGFAQEEVLPQRELFTSLQPAVDVVISRVVEKRISTDL